MWDSKNTMVENEIKYINFDLTSFTVIGRALLYCTPQYLTDQDSKPPYRRDIAYILNMTLAHVRPIKSANEAIRHYLHLISTTHKLYEHMKGST